MNLNELLQGPQQQGSPMYPGGAPGPGGPPMPMGGPPQGGQPQIPPQMLQMLLMKLMQQQGMGQQMAPPEQTPYEKWAAPGSIGSIPPGTTPLNKINGTPPGGPQGPMPSPTYTTGVRG